jgi:glycosyltransferase involved in cell wall biosynthesis
MKKRLSVVVPVFNVEQYLRHFLNSLIKATSAEDELILVNDGSTDESGKILRDYSLIHERIRLIDQPNAGVSEARNRGLRLAQGDWIAFADPDDWVDDAYYERAIGQAVKTDAEIIISNAMYCFERTGEKTPVFNEYQYLPVEFMSGQEALSNFLQCKHLPHMVWMHLYQRKFLTNSGLLFLSATDGNEDVLWTFKAFLSATRVSFVKEPGYCYRIISGRKRTDSYYLHKINAAILNARGIVDLCAEYVNNSPSVREHLDYHVVDGVLSIFHHMSKLKSRCLRREVCRRLREENFFWFVLQRAHTWKLRKRIIKQYVFSFL